VEKSGLPVRRKSGARAICVNDIVREASRTPRKKKTAVRRRLEKNPAFYKTGKKKPLAVEKMIPVPEPVPPRPQPKSPLSPAGALSDLLAKAAAALPQRPMSA
jgi:hypothetical protein